MMFIMVKVLLGKWVTQDPKEQEDQRAAQVQLKWNHSFFFFPDLGWHKKQKLDSDSFFGQGNQVQRGHQVRGGKMDK